MKINALPEPESSRISGKFLIHSVTIARKLQGLHQPTLKVRDVEQEGLRIDDVVHKVEHPARIKPKPSETLISPRDAGRLQVPWVKSRVQTLEPGWHLIDDLYRGICKWPERPRLIMNKLPC